MADELTTPRPAGSRGTLYVALGATANGVAAFGFQIVATRALGPVAYAPISVLWTLQYLWIAVVVTAVEAYVTRAVTLSGGSSPTVRRFTRLLGRWLTAAAAVTVVVGWVLREALFEGIGELAVVLGLIVFGYGVHGVVRGRAAGLGRFAAYGLATMGESVLRLVLVSAVLLVIVDPRAVAWTFPAGPMLVAVFAWWRWHPTAWRTRRNPADAPEPTSDADAEAATSGTDVGADTPSGADADADTAISDRDLDTDSDRDTATSSHDRTRTGRARQFLLATSGANMAVQVLLAGGPIVLVPLGADAATISVFFTTATTARVPLTFALNGGLSRLLPPLTRMVRDGDVAGLRKATRSIILVIVIASALGAVAAAAVGPAVLALLFGEGFRPDAAFVAVIAVAAVLAFGGLLLDQLYIAMGRERQLPLVWFAAVGLAAVLVVSLPGDASMRVASGFAIATGAATGALSIPLLRGSTSLDSA